MNSISITVPYVTSQQHFLLKLVKNWHFAYNYLSDISSRGFSVRYTLPQTIGHGRLDTILAVLAAIPVADGPLELDWSRARSIAPAGLAMLACLSDLLAEHQMRVVHHSLSHSLRHFPVVQYLLRQGPCSCLPKPSIHDFAHREMLLRGQEIGPNFSFADELDARLKGYVSDEVAFSARMIANELMINAADHSTAERYYIYGGLFDGGAVPELHVGVLDMGVSIPAKLEQKYSATNDQEYLDMALRQGVTTRRIRQGGMGLSLTLSCLNGMGGTLTVISRKAQLIRYFRNKVVQRRELKTRLRGTWCMARIPLHETSS